MVAGEGRGGSLRGDGQAGAAGDSAVESCPGGLFLPSVSAPGAAFELFCFSYVAGSRCSPGSCLGLPVGPQR